MTRPMVALLSTLTLLMAVGAALTDPAPWLYAAVSWLVLSLVVTAVYVVAVTIMKARRRARQVQVVRRHPSSRGWDSVTPRWPSMPTPLHGTKSGYKNHRTAGETPCPDCLAAYVAFHAYYRFKRGRQRHLAACTDCGSVFPEHLCAWTGVRV